MIKEISLKNFKCFDELKLDRLKTFNVIAGKNNFGKTSILDALFAFYGVKNPGILLNIQGFRKEITFLSSDKPFWVDYFKDSGPLIHRFFFSLLFLRFLYSLNKLVSQYK